MEKLQKAISHKLLYLVASISSFIIAWCYAS